MNHSHIGIDAKLDLDANRVARNDLYALVEEGLTGTLSAGRKKYMGPAPTLKQKQMGELVVAHIDCDTAPFMWKYADHFTLLDNFFDTVIGPSTPNAIAMIAGQSGETQWVKHPELGNPSACNNQLPLTADPAPYWGSALDVLTHGQRQPTARGGAPVNNPAPNLTFAILPLSFMGDQIQKITAQDLSPAFDLQDVQADIQKIAGDHNKPVNWAWFQEGYDHEPTDPPSGATHLDYVAHHNAPQYFGYEANNPSETGKHLKGLADFYAMIRANALPANGGVFYVRGGFGNIDGLAPRLPSRSVQANFRGNDDHPGYSDVQISEAQLADAINAIAGSKYWAESAIIITYDESDGLYDHAQPRIRSFDPEGNALDQGPRIPAIVISPYGKVHAISHEPSEHSSIIKFIDKLFNLTPLADLPDEASARREGLKKYGQKDLGPGDSAGVPIGSLFSAFDNRRLLGTLSPLPPQFAMIPRTEVARLPHFGGRGCNVLQIRPTDIVNGKVIDPAPRDFNPRPSSNPGLPTTPGWPAN